MPAPVAEDFEVFLSNWNHGRFLGEALDAMLGQSLLPRAIHVVDDASTDDSAAVILRYARRWPDLIRPTFLTANRGVVANMSAWLMEEGRAPLVYFAAADDRVRPGFFETAVAALHAWPEAALASAQLAIIDDQGKPLGLMQAPSPSRTTAVLPPAEIGRLLLRHDSWINGCTTVYRSAPLRALGGFHPPLAGFVDGFAARVVALQHGAVFIPEVLAEWRRAPTGMAGRTVGDVEMARAVAAEAVRLMTTAPLAPLFPPGYPARWRARWIFGAAALWVGAKHGRRRALRRLLDSPTLADAVTLSSHLPAIGPLIGRAILAVALRPFDLMERVRRSTPDA